VKARLDQITQLAPSADVPSVWVPRAIGAARRLQPLWSQPDAKPPRFEDGLDAAKARFQGIMFDLDLESPKELAQ